MKNARKELLLYESKFNMRTNIAIGNHRSMDTTKENESGSTVDGHFHLWLKSKKYHQSYEVFWSQKFGYGLKSFNNRSLTSVLSQIKKRCENPEDDIQIPHGWVSVKDMQKDISDNKMKGACARSWDQLINLIEVEKIANDLDVHMDLEEDKQNYFDANSQSSGTSVAGSEKI